MNKEVTTVAMPSGLIEGAESMLLFTLMIVFPDHQVAIYAFFCAGVVITILQRLYWAYYYLEAKN